MTVFAAGSHFIGGSMDPRTSLGSTAVDQVVACAPVTQRARVGYPTGTSFLGEVFSGFSLTCKTNVGKF